MVKADTPLTQLQGDQEEQPMCSTTTGPQSLAQSIVNRMSGDVDDLSGFSDFHVRTPRTPRDRAATISAISAPETSLLKANRLIVLDFDGGEASNHSRPRSLSVPWEASPHKADLTGDLCVGGVSTTFMMSNESSVPKPGRPWITDVGVPWEASPDKSDVAGDLCGSGVSTSCMIGNESCVQKPERPMDNGRRQRLGLMGPSLQLPVVLLRPGHAILPKEAAETPILPSFHGVAALPVPDVESTPSKGLTAPLQITTHPVSLLPEQPADHESLSNPEYPDMRDEAGDREKPTTASSSHHGPFLTSG